MTEEAQRIAIAKIMGFDFGKGENGTLTVMSPEKRGCNYQDHNKEAAFEIVGLPDYLHDLNAMHDVEKTLSNNQYLEYISRLHKVVFGVEPNDICNIVCSFRMIHATSEQRAEAFLRATGRWVE